MSERIAAIKRLITYELSLKGDIAITLSFYRIGQVLLQTMKAFFRVVYQSKDCQLKSRNFHDFETASRIAANLSQRFRDEGEYTVEATPLSELQPEQLARLFQSKLITYRELATYAGAEIAEQELRRKYSLEESA